MKKDAIIIVEGPQGAGKTTFTNYLREEMSATDLFRLTGIKDRTETGHQKIKLKYEKLLDYMECCSDVNMVFDRTFFSNEIYSRLGYHNYSFTDTYNHLLNRLDNLKNLDKYDIYFVVLYLKDEAKYEERLKRDKHQYQKFDIKSSITQQREYLKMADEIENNCKNIKVIKFNNDTKEDFNENIKKYFSDYIMV